MDELIEQRMPAIGQQQRDAGQRSPKQNHPLLRRRVNRCPFLQRKKQRPSGEQHDDDAGVFARAGVALQKLVFILSQAQQLGRLRDGNVHLHGQFTGDQVFPARCSDDFLHLGDAIQQRVLPH